MQFHTGSAITTVLTFAFVVIFAPAGLLESAGSPSNPIKIVGCTGWLWRTGSCQMFLRFQDGWMSAGMISYVWRVSRDSGVYLTLAHDGRDAGTIYPQVKAWTARSLEFRLSPLPSGLLPKYVSDAWQPSGRLALSMPLVSCDWDGRTCVGKGRIRIDGLRAGKSGNLLGDYHIDIEFRSGGKIEGQLTTQSGPLILEGTFEQLSGKQAHVVGQATVGVEVGEDVRQLFRTIGQPAGPNSFTFSGSL